MKCTNSLGKVMRYTAWKSPVLHVSLCMRQDLHVARQVPGDSHAFAVPPAQEVVDEE